MTAAGSANTAVDYDIVIAGGGMVGISLALQLASRSADQLKVLVLESFSVTASKSDTANTEYTPSFDARSTALSYGSRLLLEPLGLWQKLSQHLADITQIHVSDRGHFGSAMMHCEEVNWPALGYVVENAWLGKVLMGELATKPNIDFIAPASVAAIQHSADGINVTYRLGDKDSTCSAQLAVIADGANSNLREKLGIDTICNDYQQTALISNVGFREPHLGCAFERFTDQGPMALLPLTSTLPNEFRSALVWCMPEPQAEQLCNASDEQFLQTLQRRFGHRQGEFTRVGQRFTYPLQLLQAREQVRSNLVVMGNAAHSLHPVAGQGFNLALRDCGRLAQLLAQASRQGQPLGELALLQRYVEQQHFDQQKTIGFSDQLPALFGNKQWPLSVLRGLGLGLLDITPAAKSSFIHHSAGLHDGAVFA